MGKDCAIKKTQKVLEGMDGFYLVGDAGLEPTAFGSGDQRSIHLS